MRDLASSPASDVARDGGADARERAGLGAVLAATALGNPGPPPGGGTDSPTGSADTGVTPGLLGGPRGEEPGASADGAPGTGGEGLGVGESLEDVRRAVAGNGSRYGWVLAAGLLIGGTLAYRRMMPRR